MEADMRVARTLVALTAATILLSVAAVANAQTTNTEAQSSGTAAQSTDLQSRVRAGLKARLTGATEKIQAACGEDTKSYCGNVTRGEGKLLMCMMAHEDKISVKCDYALYAATRDIGRGLDKVIDVADACWNDIETNCSNLPEGRHIAQCLKEKSASLSPGCRDAITD